MLWRIPINGAVSVRLDTPPAIYRNAQRVHHTAQVGIAYGHARSFQGAAALGVKIDYFFRPFTVEVDRVEFRKKPKFPERMAMAVREKVREELERYLEVEQLCGCSTEFSMPRKRVSNTDEAVLHANEVRKHLGLGYDGITNAIEVLDRKSVV